MEVLNFTFADMMEGADSKQRAYIMAWLEGRLGPNGRIIIDDKTLPESMQGQEAPEWWTDAPDDPMSDTFTVGL